MRGDPSGSGPGDYPFARQSHATSFPTYQVTKRKLLVKLMSEVRDHHGALVAARGKRGLTVWRAWKSLRKPHAR